MKIFIIIEVSYHVSHLINRIYKLIPNFPDSKYGLIVRNKGGLQADKLSEIHNQLQGKKELTPEEISKLRAAYGGELSLAEESLIKLEGVPQIHPLSFTVTYSTNNLNSEKLMTWLTNESSNDKLAAVIFLDCILKPWWLKIFENRIVNAHSAVLPHARGMYAIEQTAALGDSEKFMKSAGASIHYIDEKVDMGSLIAVKQLDRLWDFENIWQVKAASYIVAFDLLVNYLNQHNAFSLSDGKAYIDKIGPAFRAKDFTDSVKNQAIKKFNTMRINYLKDKYMNDEKVTTDMRGKIELFFKAGTKTQVDGQNMKNHNMLAYEKEQLATADEMEVLSSGSINLQF